MGTIELATVVQAVSSVLAFIAALIAVWVTYKAPAQAANLQREHDAELERQRERYQILKTLMEYRGVDISAPEPVAALNMIVIVFQEERNVLDAWHEFLCYTNGADNHTNRSNAYMGIIVAMEKCLGYSDQLTVAAIDRGYYPRTT